MAGFIAEVKSYSSFSISSFLGKDDTENIEYDDMENDPSSDGVEKVYLDMLNLALPEILESEKTHQIIQLSMCMSPNTKDEKDSAWQNHSHRRYRVHSILTFSTFFQGLHFVLK